MIVVNDKDTTNNVTDKTKLVIGLNNEEVELVTMEEFEELDDKVEKMEELIDFNIPYNKSITDTTQYSQKTFIDNIPMKQNKKYKIKASIENSISYNIYVNIFDNTDTKLDGFVIYAGDTENLVEYSCVEKTTSKVIVSISNAQIINTNVTIDINEIVNEEEEINVAEIIGTIKANLIPVPFSNKNSNGITWTLNDDWSVNVKGTATALCYNRIDFTLNKGEYINRT